MPNQGLIASLLPAIDSILGVRDQIGAVLQPVYFLTRTWYLDQQLTQPSDQVGNGYAKDTVVQMLPSPGIKNFSQDIRLREGGAVAAGDIILTDVSKNSYTSDQLRGLPGVANIEKLYLVGTKVYQVINVVEKYVTFDVQVRELSNQTRY